MKLVNGLRGVFSGKEANPSRDERSEAASNPRPSSQEEHVGGDAEIPPKSPPLDENSKAFIANNPALPQILSYFDDPKDVESCLKVCRRFHTVVTSNYNRLAKQGISLLVEYRRPRVYFLQRGHQRATQPAGYAFSAFMTNKKNHCFCDFSFYEGESLPKDALIPPPVGAFFANPDITDENGKVKNADECFKALMLLFLHNFTLDRLRNAYFLENEKLPLLIEVIKETGATADSYYLNSNEEWQLPILLGCKNVDARKVPFDASFLNVKTQDTNIHIDTCTPFDSTVLRRFLKEWYVGERDILHVYLLAKDYHGDLDWQKSELSEFDPMVLSRKGDQMNLLLRRKVDHQAICIAVWRSGRIEIDKY